MDDIQRMALSHTVRYLATLIDALAVRVSELEEKQKDIDIDKVRGDVALMNAKVMYLEMMLEATIRRGHGRDGQTE